MKSVPLFAGIDVGTTGVRIVIVDRERAIHGQGRAMMADFSEDHRNPGAWLAATRRAFETALGGLNAGDIQAIAVDGTSGTVLSVEETGTPLAGPMMYNDAVDDDAIVARINAVAPSVCAARGANSGLARAIVLAGGSSRARIVHQADWIAGHLSGRFDTTDENNALKTGYDAVARRWPEWLTETGIGAGVLPAVVAAGTAIGPATGPLARAFGLSSRTIVVAGTTDGCASFLATGADAAGDAVSALGSTLTIKLLCDAPVSAPDYGIYSHRIGDRWLAGGASNTGGNVIAAHFNPDQVAALSDRIDPNGDTGLGYYPLARPGERFPFNDPAMPPKMSPRPADDTLFLKAILEGIADIEALGYRRLTELGAPALTTIRTVGGGAGNRAWKTMRQNRLRVPFVAPLSEEAAMGAAILAERGAGQTVDG